jgi:hypothetical protein
MATVQINEQLIDEIPGRLSIVSKLPKMVVGITNGQIGLKRLLNRQVEPVFVCRHIRSPNRNRLLPV